MNDIFRILSLKALGAKGAGAASATIFFFNDVFTFVSSTILGIIASNAGYKLMWLCCAGLALFNIFFFAYVNNHGFKQLTTLNPEAEALEGHAKQ